MGYFSEETSGTFKNTAVKIGSLVVDGHDLAGSCDLLALAAGT